MNLFKRRNPTVIAKDPTWPWPAPRKQEECGPCLAAAEARSADAIRQRDQARNIAVALEQELAELRSRVDTVHAELVTAAGDNREKARRQVRAIHEGLTNDSSAAMTVARRREAAAEAQENAAAALTSALGSPE